MKLAPGIHDIPADAYHADPCEAPSLSSSIAAILLEQSPWHARHAHPRLNPDFVPEERKEFDLGSAAHAVLLGAGPGMAIVDADDWRTKAAQAARTEARAIGMIPVLRHQAYEIAAMVAAAHRQLDAHEARDAFMDGKPEQTLVWREGDLWCRARLDFLPAQTHRSSIIYDFKTTTNAEPAAWSRTKITAMGYDVQASFYLRGLRALGYPETLRFAFVVAEMAAPYGLSVIGLSPAMIALADQKVEHAIRIWRECIATDSWPAYPQRICWADPMPWDEARWQERMARDPRPAPAALEAARNWQRPIA